MSAAKKTPGVKLKPGTGPVPPIAQVLGSPAVLKELSKSIPGFSRAGLLADLFTKWGQADRQGGQAAFAAALVEEFRAAPKGSVVRQRILDMVIRLINWHSDDVHARPVEDMTEEELVAAIDASMPRLAALSRYAEGEPPPAPIPPARFPELADESGEPQGLPEMTPPPAEVPAEETMGTRMRRHRIRRGFSIADLVVDACLTRRQVREFEEDKKIPTVEVRRRIADALGLTLDQFDSP